MQRRPTLSVKSVTLSMSNYEENKNTAGLDVSHKILTIKFFIIILGMAIVRLFSSM